MRYKSDFEWLLPSTHRKRSKFYCVKVKNISDKHGGGKEAGGIDLKQL